MKSDHDYQGLLLMAMLSLGEQMTYTKQTFDRLTYEILAIWLRAYPDDRLEVDINTSTAYRAERGFEVFFRAPGELPTPIVYPPALAEKVGQPWEQCLCESPTLGRCCLLRGHADIGVPHSFDRSIVLPDLNPVRLASVGYSLWSETYERAAAAFCQHPYREPGPTPETKRRWYCHTCAAVVDQRDRAGGCTVYQHRSELMWREKRGGDVQWREHAPRVLVIADARGRTAPIEE